MSLVVYSNQNLNEIESYVSKLFSEVENKNIGTISYHDAIQPFTEKELKSIRKIKTISKSRSVTLKFILPSMRSKFRSNPTSILSFFLGHEGKGSLLSYLIREGLAMELGSYPMNIDNFFTIFGVDITLTEKGMNNTDQVIKSVFEYFYLLKKEGFSESHFKEIQTINNLSFEFRSKSPGLNKALEFANLLPHCPPELINKYHFMLEEYKPEEFLETLKLLTPENLLIEIKNHELEGLPLKEKIYGTEYSFDPISPELVKEINEILEGKKALIFLN
jgi:secreted Zn-dependent insulinase-like peptidase